LSHELSVPFLAPGFPVWPRIGHEHVLKPARLLKQVNGWRPTTNVVTCGTDCIKTKRVNYC